MLREGRGEWTRSRGDHGGHCPRERTAWTSSGDVAVDETGWDASRGARPNRRGREMPAEVVTSVLPVGRTGENGEDATMDEATGRPQRVSPPLTPTRGTAVGDVAADAQTRGEGG